MFSRQAETVKEQLATLRKQASELYTIVDGKAQLKPGVSKEQVVQVTRKLKQVNDIYSRSLREMNDLNQELSVARGHAAKTRGKMVALEEYFSDRLGRKVEIFPKFLRACYDL